MSAQASFDRDHWASSRARSSGGRTRYAAEGWFDRLAPAMFGLFMASLIALLVLLMPAFRSFEWIDLGKRSRLSRVAVGVTKEIHQCLKRHPHLSAAGVISTSPRDTGAE